MKARDAAIVGAIMLIAGFAAADAFRSRASNDAARPPTTASRTDETETRTLPAQFAPVPARGSLAFTDRADCRVRDISVATGTESALPRLGTSCELWSAPAGNRIAYGLGRPYREAVPFRFVDLSEPERELGGFHALFGYIAWSADGRRAAWCGQSRTGFDLELGGSADRLGQCPTAYTPDSEVAYAVANRIVAGDRVVLRARGFVSNVVWGRDRSLAIVIEGRHVERYERGAVTGAREIPPSLRGSIPVFSPDNCAVLLRRGPAFHLLDVGCFAGDEETFEGSAVSWSPDGRWIAVAEDDSIAFHRVVGAEGVMSWPVAAAELAWRDG